MATTLTYVKHLLDQLAIKYSRQSTDSAIFLGFDLPSGRSLKIVITVDLDGTYLEFRSIDLPPCSQAHPMAAFVKDLLLGINHTTRFVKFGWDISSGVISGAGDVWIMDTELTPELLRCQVWSFVMGHIDLVRRLHELLDTPVVEAQEDKPAEDDENK